MSISNPGKTSFLMLAAALATVVSAAVAVVTAQVPKDPIKWSMKALLPDKPLKPGDTFSLQLTATIAEGWHLYSTNQPDGGPTPTRIVVPSEQPFEQDGAIQSSEPESVMDPNFNLMTEYYEGEATFSIPIKVSAAAAPGKSEAKVNVSFQTCNDELCLPPKTVKLAAEVQLTR